MIKPRLFTQYAFYGFAISVLFLVLAHLTTNWVMQFSEAERRRVGGPFKTFETLLNQIPAENRVALLEKIRRDNPNERIVNELILLDANGKILYPSNVTIDLESLDRDQAGPPATRTQLDGSPSQTLIFKMAPPPGGPGGPRGPTFGPPGFWRIHFVQAIALFSAVLLTVFIMISTLRGKARIADQVIQDLTRGNLNARFPISRMDEVGQMMFSFNKMADEIEHLIEHLRKAESARRDLLRELAHDLRTPIASLKALIETANSQAAGMSAEKRTELLDVALRETDYFAGLVDDLLFLGKVGEPRYKTSDVVIELTELIETESDALVPRYPSVHFQLSSHPDTVSFKGDPSLLKRMIRNALENAFSFARSRVEVSLVKTSPDSAIEIVVRDDGEGFSSEALEKFGQRKFSRAVAKDHSRRISIGLGTVIMKSVVDAYRGDIKPGNSMDSQTGRVQGAEVRISLPAV